MLKLNFNPSEKHLADIKNWLTEEWEKTNSGFFSNWDMIPKAFADKRLSVITNNDIAIGFVCYWIMEFHADIDIAEIKPSERKKGVAKKLISGTLEYFANKGALATKLYCSPENSELFWKKIGFKNFPKLIDDTKIHMFKTHISTLETTKKPESNSIISLWNCEPYQAKNEKAKWIWDLNFETDNKTLIKPIILPVSGEWQIELILNGQKILSNKLKKVNLDLADYGRFMIIREISV